MTNHQAELQQLRQAYQGEKLFRPSSIERIMHCPGSVRLSADVPRSTIPTKHQAIGSAAHKIAEWHLSGQSTIDDHVGRLVRYDKHLPPVPFDQAMADALKAYPEYIAQFQTRDTELHLETRMTLANLDPTDPVLAENSGTADAVLLNHFDAELHIFDLKFGEFVRVKPDSAQYRNYALLALYTFRHPDRWKKITITGVQPRHVDTKTPQPVSYTQAELMIDFQDDLIEAMYRALEPTPELHTGEWCRWCPAGQTGKCTLQTKEAFGFTRHPGIEYYPGSSAPKLPKLFFGTTDQPEPMVTDTNTAVIKPAHVLTPEECALAKSRQPVLEAWYNAVDLRIAAYIRDGVPVVDPTTGAEYQLTEPDYNDITLVPKSKETHREG